MMNEKTIHVKMKIMVRGMKVKTIIDRYLHTHSFSSVFLVRVNYAFLFNCRFDILRV
jgi:hypothetical protein